MHWHYIKSESVGVRQNAVAACFTLQSVGYSIDALANVAIEVGSNEGFIVGEVTDAMREA